MRDNHLHTHLSYDSGARLEDCLEYYDGDVVTTEYYDLSNSYTRQDDTPDYDTYSREIAELNARYGNHIKHGIEIGYYEPREADIIAFLANKDCDLKPLSVRRNGINDYLDDGVVDVDRNIIIQEYFDKLEHATGHVEADVSAHSDYGSQFFEISVIELQAYEEQLRRIFQKMIDSDLTLELNNKSVYLYHHEDLYRYALGPVRELGGHKYSIGSNRHKLEHFRLAFDKIQTLLGECDIKEWRIS